MRIFENVNILENGYILIEKETANFHHIYNEINLNFYFLIDFLNVFDMVFLVLNKKI